MMDGWKEHAFEYDYQGKRWAFDIWARSEAEARERLSRLTFARYVGTIEMTIPVHGGGFLHRVWNWITGKAG